MNIYLKNLFLIVLSITSYITFGQEIETDLFYNAEQNAQYNQEKQFAQKSNKTPILIDLPFFDDFSRYSLPTNNPDIPADWQRWEDNNVYVNSTMAINPPSIGVATFDGLDETGYPYNFNSSGNEHLPSDTLTSVPINLAGFGQNNHIYLVFYYQAKGNGNSPEPEDSLKLEFKIGDDAWVTKWVTPGIESSTTSTPFQEVLLEVWDEPYGNFYFQNNFQFRFIGYSEQRGNLDHWNLDYVYMNQNIDPETFFFQELAITNPKNTLLNGDLTAMPWTHFKDNPSARMLNGTTILDERNNSNNDFNFRSGYQVTYQNTTWDFLNSWSNTNNNMGLIETPIEINTGDNSFVFDTNVNDTCATFDVTFYHEFKDNFTKQNDSTSFIQNFSDYYAYDDGTAERAWALNNAAGGKVAVKFDSYIPDTLLGIWVNFTPFQESSATESFILRVWDDDNGHPGNELGENFTFHYPEYPHHGHNKFIYYPFDNPTPVSGHFYVGWVQQEADLIRVGLDKNTNTNSIATFFSTGLFSDWTQSEVEGSLMIRPVLKAGKTTIATVGISELENNPSPWKIYPNPVEDILHLQSQEDNHLQVQVSIFDGYGKLISNEKYASNAIFIDTKKLESGVYFIQVIDAEGRKWENKFIKSN